MDDITVASLAQEAYENLETRKRGEESITVVKDDGPDWVKDLCHAAHEDMMPDDFVYDVVSDALEALSEDENTDETEWADNGTDIYTHDLNKWLSSNLKRAGYVDEAVREFGHSEQGINGDIMAGQMVERAQIFRSVRESLENRLEEVEDAEA